MAYGSVAKSARLQKEREPGDFCPTRNCLWRTGGGLCPNHGGPSKKELAEKMKLQHALFGPQE